MRRTTASEIVVDRLFIRKRVGRVVSGSVDKRQVEIGCGRPENLPSNAVQMRKTAENERVACEGRRGVESRRKVIFREYFELGPRLENEHDSVLVGAIDSPVGKHGRCPKLAAEAFRPDPFATAGREKTGHSAVAHHIQLAVNDD